MYIDDAELAILHGLSAERKLSIAMTLWRQAWALKAAGVRMTHPEWTAGQVDQEVRLIFSRDRA